MSNFLIKIRESYGNVYFFLMISFLIVDFSISENIVINEFLASNQTVNFDEDGDYSDWIELYHTGDSLIDLSGYTLTDDPGEREKWTFPSIILNPGEYLLLWASGKNRKDVERFHVNFKLSADGEFIGLFTPTGEEENMFFFGPQEGDVSCGRFPDGGDSLVTFQQPTPGSSNLKEVKLTIYPLEGVYQGNVIVTMNKSDSEGEIRFTLSGSEPTKYDRLYKGPVTLTKSQVLQARIFLGNEAVCEKETRTYILNDDPQLPVLSIITPHESLWDSTSGIYVHYQMKGRDWERPCHVTLLENGETCFSLPAGFRIHGGTSRALIKKNFRLYFRSEYGQSRLSYSLFPQKQNTEFKRLLLYSPSNDQITGITSTLKPTYISDVLSHSLWHEIGGYISAFKPVSLYLNGEYWGLYWIREYINRHYFEYNYEIEDVDLNEIMKGGIYPDVLEGDNKYWMETYHYIENHDLSIQKHYEYVIQNYIDIHCYTDYHMINIYGAPDDWLHDNVHRFRDRTGDPRWKFIMWDMNDAWRINWPDHRMLEWVTRDHVRPNLNHGMDYEALLSSTLILRKLLENNQYRHYFINRFADLMNTLLTKENIQSHIAYLVNMILPEIEREYCRWKPRNPEAGLSDWESFINRIYRFAERRSDFHRQHMIDYFNLTGADTLTILEPIGEGEVGVNSIKVDGYPWKGVYFRDIPITIKANPASGYTFYQWSDTTWQKSPEISLVLDRDTTIQAIFYTSLSMSEVIIEDVTDSSAVLIWSTNQPSVIQVEYGTAFYYGQKTERTVDFKTEHCVMLDSLDSETVYHYRIWNWDCYGDSMVSEDKTFITEEALPSYPAIESMFLDSIGVHSARIVWETDEKTTGIVDYGPDTTYGESVSDTIYSLSHSVWLFGLMDSTVYHLRIRCHNDVGLEGSGSDMIFTTLYDHEAPIIIKFWTEVINHSTIEVFWETNEETIGRVEYGLTDTLGSFSEMTTDTISDHRILLEGLYSDTIYYYCIRSWDRNGNFTVSDRDTFRTEKIMTGISDCLSDNGFLPDRFFLSENYPNPFNGRTVWRLSLPESGNLDVEIFDLIGRKVISLYHGSISSGSKHLFWDGYNEKDCFVSNGMYFLRVRFGSRSGNINRITKRMVFYK